jgi:tripartite-type tricarboxylate transporter receptor subunit TctC
MKDRVVIEAIDKLGLETYVSTPEEFGQIIKTDWPKWRDAVKAAGVKPQ